MPIPYIGEIRIFAGNYPPQGWAICDGQQLSIADYPALFAVIGTIYGGNGRTTMALPNLQGRVPLHPGNGPGLSQRRIGQKGGIEAVTLEENEMPQHTHGLMTAPATTLANTDSPEGAVFASSEEHNPYRSASAMRPMADPAMVPAGGSHPHNNMQPYLTVNFIIALEGIFPQRN